MMRRTIARAAAGTAVALSITAVAVVGGAILSPADAAVYRSDGHRTADDRAFNCLTDRNGPAAHYCHTRPSLPAPARFRKPGMECVGDSWAVMCADGRILWFGDGTDPQGERDRRAYQRHVMRVLTAG